MLISVIVPVFNVEKYLERCIESILNQTYKKLEIILIDDGSTDKSGIICDRYAEKYSNIIVSHKKNEGLGMARNTGMKLMHGKYVTFLDSDDFIKDDMIEKMYSCIVDYNIDMCKTGFIRVDNNDNEILKKIQYDNEIFAGENASKMMLPRMIGSAPDKKDSIEMAVCGVLYKSSIIKKNKIVFPSERQMISEDLVFNINYMQFANGSCTSDYCGYYYRYNVESLTKKYREDRFEAVTKFYLEIRKKLKNLKYNNDTMFRLSRMYFIYLKKCLSQEIPKISKKKRKQNLQRIKEICKNDVVKQIINEYPIKELGVKQKIFLNLIKYKLNFIIYLCAKFRLI